MTARILVVDDEPDLEARVFPRLPAQAALQQADFVEDCCGSIASPVPPPKAAPARNRTLQTFHDPLVWRELVRGDRLRVMRGRFEGQLALFEGMAGRERVAVLLALMRGERRVLLPRKAVERYRSGQARA